VPNVLLSFEAEMDGGLAAHHGDTFRAADLRVGSLRRYERNVSHDTLARYARINCSRFPPWQAFPHWVIAGLLSAVVGSAFLLWRRPWRRHKTIA
jgi:hypothetical protein